MMALVTLIMLQKGVDFKVLLTLGSASTRCFSKHQLARTGQNFSVYESIQREYKPEVPVFFNFAKDVVDKWAKAETVDCAATSLFQVCTWSPSHTKILITKRLFSIGII